MLRPTMTTIPPWVPYQQQSSATPVQQEDSNLPPSETPRRNEWFPDVYSTPFVSEYERSINTLPASPIKALPPPYVDFPRFVENFAGKGFLTPWAPAAVPLETSTNIVVVSSSSSSSNSSSNRRRGGDKKEKNKASIISPSTRNGITVGPSVLDAANYGVHFLKLLAKEIAGEDGVNKSYNLYNVVILSQDANQCLFRLPLPGIRENTPMVQLGDLIRLRQVRPGLPGCYPWFTGYEYETYVYGMDKTVGYVLLRADGLWLVPDGRFNVIFGVQEQRWEGARRAVTNIGNSLPIPNQKVTESPEPAERPFLQRMLFPEKSDGKIQRTLTRGVFEAHWIDKELNYEQVSAHNLSSPSTDSIGVNGALATGHHHFFGRSWMYFVVNGMHEFTGVWCGVRSVLNGVCVCPAAKIC